MVADTVLTTDVWASADTQFAIAGPYYIDANEGAYMYSDAGFDLTAGKTANGGADAFSTVNQAEAGLVVALKAWFEPETPGRTSPLVHCAWLDHGSTSFRYANYNIDTNVWSTIIAVASGLTTNAVTLHDHQTWVTVAQDGGILCGFEIEGFESGSFRSTDGGSTFPTISDTIHESGGDYKCAYPATTDDTADAALLIHDHSANELSVIIYDQSLNVWVNETTIYGSIVENFQRPGFDAAVRLSDGHILGAVHNAGTPAATDDLQVFRVIPTLTPTVDTSGANVFDNTDQATHCQVHIDQRNNWIRVAWVQGGTYGTNADVVSALSRDGMATWDATKKHNQDGPNDDIRLVHTGRTSLAAGGHYQPIWYEDDAVEILTNLNTDEDLSEKPLLAVSRAS